MKLFSIVFLAISLSFISCKSENRGEAENSASSIWTATPENIEGTYTGEFPCSNCQSENVSLKLDMDQSVMKTVSKVGNSETVATTKLGSWSINQSSDVLSLDFDSGSQKEFYKITQDQLVLMDSETATKPNKEAKKFTLTRK